MQSAPRFILVSQTILLYQNLYLPRSDNLSELFKRKNNEMCKYCFVFLIQFGQDVFVFVVFVRNCQVESLEVSEGL